jgi:beta-glucosidase-like glycosyl hydrolase
MTQTGFDFDAAQAACDAGIDRACNPFFRRELLKSAKAHALALGHSLGLVTVDDVKRRMLNYGEDPELLGNAAGGIFRNNPAFEYSGSKQSERELRHAGRISVWRLKA